MHSMKRPSHITASFQKTIRGYYTRQGRSFPWRETMDPYAILVSEVMLQQTQTDRVVSKYAEWIKVFPTVEVLAQAPQRKVLTVWQGLGYNRRALNLHRLAQVLVREYKGIVPRDTETLESLPGIGPYTAGAIRAFAFDEPGIFLETNIRAVYLHFFFGGSVKVSDKELLLRVAETLPRRSIRTWYNALMDYGAMLKRTKKSFCDQSIHYTKQTRFRGSRRELRGEIIRQASKKKNISPKDFKIRNSEERIQSVFSDLVREGFLKQKSNTYTLI